MASPDKESSAAADGFAIPLPLEPKKRKITTNEKVCIICLNYVPDTPLRKAKESSIEKLINVSKQRCDDEVETRLQEIGITTNTEVHWHGNCYASYTSVQNIRYASSSTDTKEYIHTYIHTYFI